jgi:hypothetical protein
MLPVTILNFQKRSNITRLNYLPPAYRNYTFKVPGNNNRNRLLLVDGRTFIMNLGELPDQVLKMYFPDTFNRYNYQIMVDGGMEKVKNYWDRMIKDEEQLESLISFIAEPITTRAKRCELLIPEKGICVRNRQDYGMVSGPGCVFLLGDLPLKFITVACKDCPDGNLQFVGIDTGNVMKLFVTARDKIYPAFTEFGEYPEFGDYSVALPSNVKITFKELDSEESNE